MQKKTLKNRRFLIVIMLLLVCMPILANTGINFPGVNISFTQAKTAPHQLSAAFQILILLTVLSLAPAILIMVTSFSRIIIVLSMLRHAFGLQQTPPNSVLISLALFLTVFSMMPVLHKIYQQALQPYLAGKIQQKQAAKKALLPIRNFMIRQTHERDMALILKISHSKKPKSVNGIPTYKLIPAFMISELQTAFEIGFVIFIPFILIDLLVAGILMSLGMVMVPPMSISLPIKILVFVLINGWGLVIQSLLSSFH